MTVVGKILVFVNLVASLLTAGLIIMVYTTRINWYKAYNDQSAAVRVIRADAVTTEAAQAEELKRRDAEFQQLFALKGKLEGDSKSLAEQLAKTKADYENVAKTTSQINQVSKDAAAELEPELEVETAKKQISELDKKISDIDHQMTRLRDESVQYRIQWEQTKDKLRLVQDQVVGLTQENGRLRQQLGGAAPSAAPVVPNAGGAGPAPRIEDLQGTVQKVEGDLVTITPGSDAGITVGSKLRVFHLQPKPEFLGEVTILAVKPTEAVGRLTGPKARQVKKGDEVDAH